MKVARKTDNPYTVEAVLRALDILDAFEGSQELTLHEISKRTALNKSRCFRLLHTLASRNYVERTASGQSYRLSSRLLDRRVDTRDMREIAHPHLIRLRDQFNETVNLGLIHNGEILYVDLIESQRVFRMSAMIGSRMPIATTAMGKAMLAALPWKTGLALLAGRPVSRKLKVEIEQVRKIGHSIDNEDNEPGVACIGACILDGDGLPAAAVSISGPVHRILIREREIAATLRQVCQRVSEQLGLHAVTPAASKSVVSL